MIFGQQGLNLNWYRSISNDKYADQTYYPASYNKPVFTYKTDEKGKFITIVSDMQAVIQTKDKTVIIPYTVRYLIYSNGTMDVDADFTKPANGDMVHRLGLQMALPSELEQIEWYGRGPRENYPDRKQSAFFGLYKTTVKGMEEEHYVRSQSMGNREEIRWLILTNENNKGLKITSKDHLSFTALHFTDNELWSAKHDFNLDNVRKPEVYLSLDCIQQGLGNASCGPIPLPQYMIPADKPISYSFRIESYSDNHIPLTK
jgi:beta-galactosidase